VLHSAIATILLHVRLTLTNRDHQFSNGYLSCTPVGDIRLQPWGEQFSEHQFAFAGLLRCAHDGCTVTTELQKGRYVYYRCSQSRGKCQLPYMREQDVANRLGEILKGISVPEDVASQIVGSLRERS
jgi:hypothetical protein